MQEESKLLIKYYLEKKGYLVSLDIPLPKDMIEVRVGRPEGEIDLIAVKLVNGRQESAIIGVIRPWWESGLTLTPRLIQLQLEGDKKHLSSYFSQRRIEYILRNFGLAGEPERVLFFPRKSPTKSKEAEEILAKAGISVIYLEDILCEIYPVLKDELRGTKSMLIKTLAAFYPTNQFEQKIRETKKKPEKKVIAVQLELF